MYWVGESCFINLLGKRDFPVGKTLNEGHFSGPRSTNARFEGKRVGRIAFGDYLYTFRIDSYGNYRFMRRRAIL